MELCHLVSKGFVQAYAIHPMTDYVNSLHNPRKQQVHNGLTYRWPFISVVFLVLMVSTIPYRGHNPAPSIIRCPVYLFGRKLSKVPYS